MSLTLLASLAFVVLEVGVMSDWWRLTPVLSGSMAPAMPTGSLAIVEPVARRDLRRGDIIVYSAPIPDHRVVAHRVAELERHDAATLIHTKGDANRTADPWNVSLTGTVAWRVEHVLPAFGWFGVIIGSALLRSVMLVAFAAVLLHPVIRRAWQGESSRLTRSATAT